MASRSLPAWFLANRVKGHTRLSFSAWHGTPEFAQAAAGFKALGAGAFTRHVKTRDEDPWPGTVWQEIIDEAHAEGLKIVAYYWHQTLAAHDEEWVCHMPDGSEIEGERGIHLDITGPYRETVLEHLRRLADLGADASMFDERHLPPRGCWGSALEEAFIAETGQPSAPPPDDANPLYRQFLDFKAQKIEDTFAYWRDEVKKKHPEVVFIVSTTTIPGLTDREMTTRLARVADSSKNEYRLALNDALTKDVFKKDHELAPDDHVRQAVGWTVLRDSAEGRPPHIWISGVPNVNHACAAAGSLVAFGCIANMDVDEQSLLGTKEPADGKTPLEGLRAAFELGRDTSPHLAAAQPVRWAAVHFAERARNARGDKYRQAWEEVLWPFVGAFQAFSEDGLPVGIVNDHQLARGELAGYRVLVLPDRGKLTATQEQAVAGFAADGGTVIENDPAWAWADPAGRDAAFAAFRAKISSKLAVTAPVRVTGGPAGRYAISYRSGERLVVAVTNNFSWVQITNRRKVLDPSEVNDPAPPAAGISVTWRKGHGLPETWDGLPFPRLFAFEAVTHKALTIERLKGAYRVALPTFDFLSLLVVGRARRPLGPHEQLPDQGPKK
jgi:hypothetical protein